MRENGFIYVSIFVYILILIALNIVAESIRVTDNLIQSLQQRVTELEEEE